MNPRELRAKKRALRGLIYELEAKRDYEEFEREQRREITRSVLALRDDHFDHVILYEAAKRPSGGLHGQWMDHLSFSAKGLAGAAMIRSSMRPMYPTALAEDVHARHYLFRKHLRKLSLQATEQRTLELDRQAREEYARLTAWAKEQESASLVPIAINPQMLWAAAFWVGIITLVINLT